MPDKATILADYTTDYDRLRAQKARNVGSVELRILTNLSFVSGEHWIGSQNRVLFTRKRDPNKLYPHGPDAPQDAGTLEQYCAGLQGPRR